MKEEYNVLKWQKECEAPPVSGRREAGVHQRLRGG